MCSSLSHILAEFALNDFAQFKVSPKIEDEWRTDDQFFSDANISVENFTKL